MIAGRLSKTNVSVVLVGNVIKQKLGLPLDDDEKAIEDRRIAGLARLISEASSG